MSGFSQERLMQVLLSPQISEKATYVADKNEQVVFKVASTATKPEVKAAVELLFKVEVKSVQISNVKGKVKRDITQPVVFAIVFATLLGWRVARSRAGRARPD